MPGCLIQVGLMFRPLSPEGLEEGTTLSLCQGNGLSDEQRLDCSLPIQATTTFKTTTSYQSCRLYLLLRHLIPTTKNSKLHQIWPIH